jgi:translation initiation factor IF-1
MNAQCDRVIETEGLIKRITADGGAEVEFADGRCISAKISARIRVRFISLRAGDRVRCEISPYDPALVRIVGCVEKVEHEGRGIN